MTLLRVPPLSTFSGMMGLGLRGTCTVLGEGGRGEGCGPRRGDLRAGLGEGLGTGGDSVPMPNSVRMASTCVTSIRRISMKTQEDNHDYCY